MEIHGKVIHITVKLQDLKPSLRREAKVKCLMHLKPNHSHKTALSLNIPSDSSPRLINLRHTLLGAKASVAPSFSTFDSGETDRQRAKKLDKPNKHKYQSSVSSLKPSASPLGGEVRSSKENFASNPEALSKKLEKYSNIYSLPLSQLQPNKTQQASSKSTRVAIKPLTNVNLKLS